MNPEVNAFLKSECFTRRSSFLLFHEADPVPHSQSLILTQALVLYAKLIRRISLIPRMESHITISSFVTMTPVTKSLNPTFVPDLTIAVPFRACFQINAGASISLLIGLPRLKYTCMSR